MSADNYFVSIPAKNWQIALYEVSASDSRINTQAPYNDACKSVAQYGTLRGTYATEGEMEMALANFHFEEQVEYNPVRLHIPPSPKSKSTP